MPLRPSILPLAAALALAAAAAPGCGSDDGSAPLPAGLAAPTKGNAPRPKPADPVDPKTGLTAAERAAFHHLAEGSEVYPLAFLLALNDPATRRPFLDNPERFGLIPDPEPNPDLPVRLPIGLTVARSRDLRFANVAMVGVNCAACHVGAVELGGKPIAILEGAPNTLDLNAYYRALAAATKATASDPSEAWAFLGRVYRMYRYTPSPPGAFGPPPGRGGGGPGGAAGKGFAGKGQGKGAGKGQGQGKGQGKAFAKKGGGPPSPEVPGLMGMPLLLFSTSPQERALFGAPPSTDRGQMFATVLASLPVRHTSLADLRKTGPAGAAVAGALERLHRDEMARPAPDFTRGFVMAAPAKPAGSGAPAPSAPARNGGPLADYAAALHRADDRALATFGPELTDASAALRDELLGELPRPVLALPAPPPANAEAPATPTPPGLATAEPAAVTDLLADFVETVRLLRARAEFLLRLAEGPVPGATEPGPGRVDAFGGARNLVFPEHRAAETAPVNYPHLWGLARTSWYHWDANTTSLLERNVGQAIGVGAVLYQGDFSSTLIVSNVERLEELATKLKPPAWPEEAFGKVDPAKFRRGAALFEQKCAACHAPPPEGEKTPDRLYSLDEIGTDPARARNFARPVGDKPFHVAIAEVLRATIAKAGGTTSDAAVWRTTEKYPGRPLIAIWATAPYLHNGSVPSLYHLLLPQEQRPKTFAVGHREYDPKRLGYAVEAPAGRGWTFDTSKPGNSNQGHSGPKFGTDLSEPDREALLEYFKANERPGDFGVAGAG